MYRHLLILTLALAIGAPGVVSVATNTSSAPASPLAAAPTSPVSAAPGAGPASSSPSASPSPSLSPSPSPSPSDTTPPLTTVSGAGPRWRRTPATLRFAATDSGSGIAATYYRVDSGAWTIGTEVVIRAPKDHGNDGEHTIAYYSVDRAANEETPRSVTVRIDTRPPRLRWRSISPGVIYRTRPVTLRFVITEATGAVRLTWRVDDQYAQLARRVRGLRRDAGAQRLDVAPRYRNRQPLLPGVYRVTIALTDEAGNVSVSAPRSFRCYRPTPARVWYSVPGAGRRVALTFDDGGSAAWAGILDTLKRYRAHASFFPLGPWAAASPALMRRTAREGHTIGSHGWTHATMSSLSYGAIMSEWTRTTALWWRVTRSTPLPYCRPPFGDMDATAVRACGDAGFCRIILWDVDPEDWRGAGASQIVARVLAHVHPGAIVCLHLRSQTAAALPAILRGLNARGYKAVSLAEMFRAAGYR